MGNFKEDIARVKAFVFDVDGVFTDGSITPTADGDFIRTYYAQDGYAVAYAVQQGYRICIISGGRGALLARRFEMLHVEDTYFNCADKEQALAEFLAKYNLDAADVIYMGDDIPDLGVMRKVGIPVCPADACSEIIEASRYVSEFKGGRGAVRDIIEQVLRSQEKWALHTKGANCVSN
ncbi:MAG: HAD hydrolase family protein [Rikenellaceae bacterium]|nr:3-deoxy-D-manno-octulosonate 8-phosphate phosphatase [Rikenellaceae bacterium]MBR2333352.1 HAD hydrolase family protein [Rikenellaceae bacterium]MBR2443454.1 HAD hydrolase family protein [Rikenellaceae bacterium]